MKVQAPNQRSPEKRRSLPKQDVKWATSLSSVKQVHGALGVVRRACFRDDDDGW